MWTLFIYDGDRVVDAMAPADYDSARAARYVLVSCAHPYLSKRYRWKVAPVEICP